MTDTATEPKPPLPDHLSVDPRSPHFVEAVLIHPIGIRLNGVEKTNAEEYCISEGWVRLPVGGKTKDRYGNPMTVKISGKVEVWYKEA
ncbi:MAG: DUF3297 family protein [Alphaproteobacteria bacterium]|nr:DUF3297 family protein [Alphaproteobacteria bacterium]